MSELFPAAQAVLDAAHDGANKVLFDIGDDSPVPMCVAAALRAAADQAAPEQPHEDTFEYCCDYAQSRVKISIRQQLLAIAAELEGHA